MNDTPPITDGEVELSLFLREHVSDRYLGWINDAETMRYTEARYKSHSRAEAEEYVAASNAGPGARLFRILYRGDHIGNLRLSDINPHHQRSDMAIIIGEPGMRGRGIGPRAISLAAEFAFGPLSLHKLTAGMYAVNQASFNAFRKAGFRHEATLEKHYLYEGAWIDGLLLGKLR
jgi:RimJ/RimL family protein N-acetyltransferase